jgi:hypothetical protein
MGKAESSTPSTAEVPSASNPQLTLDDWAGRLQAIRESAATLPRDQVITPASAKSEDRPSSRAEASGATSQRPSAAELLETPGALLTRSHLRELGLERRAVDAVFRSLAVVFLPGYSRPMIRAEEFRELVEDCTYRGDRVRPCHA